MIYEFEVEPGFSILKIHNQEDTESEFFKTCKTSVIQVHISIKNQISLLFNHGSYTIGIEENNSLLLYNPKVNLPIHLKLSPHSKYLVLLISIEKFHSFFTVEADLIKFLNDENKNKKFYADRVLEPNEIVVVNELYNYGLHSSLEKLYTKGKVFELLSLYFHEAEKDGSQKCPFLEDEKNVEKIRNAKDILIENMIDPPTLNELSNMVNLPVQHLKDGFKQIYGNTAFAYLLNYKMEYARKLLTSKKYNVAETSFEVGYSTPSHFITAFKKKFGATPKKYLSSLV